MRSLTKPLLLLFFLALILVGCATSPPTDTSNICRIFEQKPDWYWATQDVQEHYGVPESVQMAMVYKESSFVSTIQPPRKKLLGLIPWKHESTAYGYSQALDGTWDQYCRSTDRTRASRNNFYDAVNFIGWYAKDQAQAMAGVRPTDAYHLYLAYHEGINGYIHHSYRSKRDLIQFAKQVQARADRYHRQLQECADSLPKKPFWHFWDA